MWDGEQRQISGPLEGSAGSSAEAQPLQAPPRGAGPRLARGRWRLTFDPTLAIGVVSDGPRALRAAFDPVRGLSLAPLLTAKTRPPVGARIDLVLPTTLALRLDHHLPPAAAEAVLELALDRETPFSQEEVAWIATADAPRAGAAPITQWILRRAPLDALAAEIAAQGYLPGAVWLRDPTMGRIGPLSAPVWAVRRWRALRWCLCAAAALVGLSALALPYAARQDQLAELRQEATALRAEAVALRGDLAARAAAAAEAGRAADAFARAPRLGAVLTALTDALPDAVWARALEVSADPPSVRLSGEVAGSAGAVAAALQSSGVARSAQLVGAVVATDPGSERFELLLEPMRMGDAPP